PHAPGRMLPPRALAHHCAHQRNLGRARGSGLAPPSGNYALGRSAVEHGIDLRIVDVRLVVPVVAGVDLLLELIALTVDGLHRGLHHLLPDTDRVLGDGAVLDPVLDGIDLGLAGVEAHDRHLPAHAGFLHALDHTDGGAFVGAVDAGDLGVGGQQVLGDVGRLVLGSFAVLSRQQLPAPGVLLPPFHESAPSTLAASGGLVADEPAHFAFVADTFVHVLGGFGGSLLLLRGRRGQRDVGVPAAVAGDDRDAPAAG